jgi:DNA-binding protein Fis
VEELVIPESGISIEKVEKSLIEQALKMSRGNKSRAATLLGLSRATLNYRLKKFNIEY